MSIDSKNFFLDLCAVHIYQLSISYFGHACPKEEIGNFDLELKLYYSNKITFVVAYIIFKVVVINSFTGQDHICSC